MIVNRRTIRLFFVALISFAAELALFRLLRGATERVLIFKRYGYIVGLVLTFAFKIVRICAQLTILLTHLILGVQIKGFFVHDLLRRR